MEYLGYVICTIIAYFTFRIGWKIFGKTLSRWQRHRMSEWDFMQKRLAYSIALTFIFGGIPAYVIFSYSHPDHKDAFMNLNKEQEKHQSIESLKFINEGTEYSSSQTPQETSEEDITRKEEEEYSQSVQEENYENKIETESEDSIQ